MRRNNNNNDDDDNNNSARVTILSMDARVSRRPRAVLSILL